VVETKSRFLRTFRTQKHLNKTISINYMNFGIIKINRVIVPLGRDLLGNNK